MNSNNEVRYELNVEGMSCVKCAGRIENGLLTHDPPVKNLRVDFITNKVVFSLPSKDILPDVTKAIEGLGYKVKKTTDVTQSNDNTKRVIRLKIVQGDKNIVAETINTGVSGVIEESSIIGDIATITYNPIFTRGTALIEMLKEHPDYQNGQFIFQIENPFQDDDEVKFSSYTSWQVLICVFCMLSVVASSLIPEHMTMVPESWGVASYYMIFTLLMTAIIMYVVGASIFKTCFQQLYVSFNVNMITLISVGSGFAFIFGAIYFIIGLLHTFAENYNEIDYYIMNASQHLQTSAAIFTSVVAGKYVQGEIKRRIFNRITELKSSMKIKIATVTRIIPRNRKFDVLSVEQLHPALIEKDDIIQVTTGMLPFDGFVEKGTIKVTENAQFGWEAIETRSKGHRVISGSQVVSIEEDPIIRVTEPLEHTLAGKLFLEIKESTSGSSVDGKTNDIITKFTKYFIISIFAIAGVTLLFWFAAMKLGFAAFEVTISYPFEKAVAVLVASCPCALGTAIPMIYVIALRKALNNGVLVKESSKLDDLNEVNAVVFDKTGTITGTFNLGETRIVGNKYDEATIWELISTLEREHLQHPIGLALYQESLKKLSQLNKPKFAIAKDKNDTDSHKYFGAEGIIDEGIEIDGKRIKAALGNEKLLSRLGISDQIINLDKKTEHYAISDGRDENQIDDIYGSNTDISTQGLHREENKSCCSKKTEGKSCCASKKGEESGGEPKKSCCSSKNSSAKKESCCSSKKDLSRQSTNLDDNNAIEVASNTITLYVVADGTVVFRLILNLHETIKDNVHNLISGLKKYKKEIHLLTGDRRDNALETADLLGIPKGNVMAEVTPHEKEEYIRYLVQRQKKKVMMVGDGINDIKAFKEATVSCTINFKSSQNLSFSDFVIIDNDVENISALFKLASAVDFFKKLILVASIAYNIPVILAASGATMILFGFDLPAFMAAWTMFLSSVLLTLLSNGVEFVSLKKKGNPKKQIHESSVKIEVRKADYVQL